MMPGNAFQLPFRNGRMAGKPVCPIPGLFPSEYRPFPAYSLSLKAIPYSRSPYIGRGTGMDGNGNAP